MLFALLVVIVSNSRARALPACDADSHLSTVTPSEDPVRTHVERLDVISSPRSVMRVELRPVFKPNREHYVHVSIVDESRGNEVIGRYDALRDTMLAPRSVVFSPDGEHVLLAGVSGHAAKAYEVFRRTGGWLSCSNAHYGHIRLTFADDAYFVDADTIFASSGAGEDAPVRYLLSRQVAETLLTRPKPPPVTWSQTLLYATRRAARPAISEPHPSWIGRPRDFVVDRASDHALAAYGDYHGKHRNLFTLWQLRSDFKTAKPRIFDIATLFQLQRYGQPHAKIRGEFPATPILSEDESLMAEIPIVHVMRPGLFLIVVRLVGQVTWRDEDTYVYLPTQRTLAITVDAKADDPRPVLHWESPVEVSERAGSVFEGRSNGSKLEIWRGGPPGELVRTFEADEFIRP